MIRAPWSVSLWVLVACAPPPLPAPAASRRAVPVSDVLGRWERELPATFAGDPWAPAGPPATAATLALRDQFLADPRGRDGLRARQSLIGAPDAVAACAELLDRPDAPVERRGLLLEALAALPDALALAPLVRRLTDPDVALRRRAAWHLGQKDATLALPDLILRLRPLYETDDEARVWLADAVTRLGNATGLPVLAELTRNPALQELAGHCAMEALQRTDIAYEASEGWDVLRGRLDQLAQRLRTQPAPVLTPELRLVVVRQVRKLPSKSLRDVDEARFVLARLGAWAAALLAECALDRDRYIRIHSLEVLGEIGPPGAVALPAVRALLDDPLGEIYAIEVLGRMGDASAFDAMVQRLDAPRLDLRIGALKGLAALADPRAVPLLLRRFDAPTTPTEERVHAAFALARTQREPRAIQFLEHTLAQGGYHESTLRAMLAAVR